MTLEQFLSKFERSESEIIEYKGDEALKAVEQDGYTLQFVDKAIFSETAKAQEFLTALR